MSQLDTLPPSVDVGTGETPTYNFDVSGYLGTGDALKSSPSPTANVFLASTNAEVTSVVTGDPGISGNLLQVTLDCSKLAVNQSYYLVVAFNVNDTKRLQARVKLNCAL